MSDLKLLPGNEPTAFERQLLDAVTKESPTAEQRLRVREALGLPTVSVPPPLRPPPQGAGKSALVKAAAGGALAISAAAALWFLSSSTPNGASLPQAAPPAPVAAAAPAPQDPKRVPNVPVAELPLEEAPPPEKPVASSPARATPAPSAKTGSDLGDQLRLIEAARAAVAARKPAAAASAIADYRSRFPRGAFEQEASVLQIQTFDLQGNHARAAALAQSFLARYPKSPHVGVVQRIAEH